MARGSRKNGFMHIKKRTEGTSNELSFSVLDAKSNAARQEAPSPHTVTELGKVSLFTLPGKQQSGGISSSTVQFGMTDAQRRAASRAVRGATLGAQPEVAARKQRRALVRVLNVAAVLAVLAILVLVGSNVLNSMVARQQGGEVALVSGISLLEQTDAATVSLDEAVSAPASADQTSLNELFSDLSAAASLLDRASASAEEATSLDDEDAILEGSSIIKEAATARKQLIEEGRTILTQNVSAKTATDLVERAWAATLEADDQARRAADLATETATAQQLNNATELSTKALERFQDALVLLRQAKSAYPQANFQLFETYLEKRAAAQQNAIVGNAALQERDSITSAANAAAYNEAESAAAAIAAQLPENPAQPIIDKYEQIGGAADEAYQQARSRAARADAEVRDLRERLS